MRTSTSLAVLPLVLALAVRSHAQCPCTPPTAGPNTPLTQFAPGQTYLGQLGGLYPNEANQMPLAHRQAGRAEALQIQPLDRTGAVDLANGRVAFLGIGMSLAFQLFEAYKDAYADPDTGRNPALVLVNAAKSGATADDWANGFQGTFDLWGHADASLAASGLHPNQVQVAFVFMAADGIYGTAFPANMQAYRNDLVTVLNTLKTRYPNCRLAYLTSVTYLGFSGLGTSNPTDLQKTEPFGYQNAFGVKWLIEDQITASDPNLAFGASGPSPWIGWMPYLWDEQVANGGMWDCLDFYDCVHMSKQGLAKVTDDLDLFFSTDSTAVPWYAPGATNPSAAALGFRFGEGCPGGVNQNGNEGIPTVWTASTAGGGQHLGSPPFIGHANWRLRVSDAPPARPALLWLTTQKTAGIGCQLAVDVSTAIGGAPVASTTNANGIAMLDFAIPNDPLLQDAVFYGQWMVDDPQGQFASGGSSWSLARPLECRIGHP